MENPSKFLLRMGLYTELHQRLFRRTTHDLKSISKGDLMVNLIDYESPSKISYKFSQRFRINVVRNIFLRFGCCRNGLLFY